MLLDDWGAALRAELGVGVEVDIRTLLDTAREAAHNVDRPAAPLTTFLVGYAAGARGGGREDVAELCRRVAELSRTFTAGTQDGRD